MFQKIFFIRNFLYNQSQTNVPIQKKKSENTLKQLGIEQIDIGKWTEILVKDFEPNLFVGIMSSKTSKLLYSNQLTFQPENYKTYYVLE